MHTIKTITHEELLEQLGEAENSEVVDLGAVSLHLVCDAKGSRVLMENPSNDEACALICLDG